MYYVDITSRRIFHHPSRLGESFAISLPSRRLERQLNPCARGYLGAQ